MKNIIKSALLISSIVLTSSSFAAGLTKEVRAEFFSGMYGGCFEDAKKSLTAAKDKSMCKCMVGIYDNNMSNDDVERIINIAVTTQDFTADAQFIKLANQSATQCI